MFKTRCFLWFMNFEQERKRREKDNSSQSHSSIINTIYLSFGPDLFHTTISRDPIHSFHLDNF